MSLIWIPKDLSLQEMEDSVRACQEMLRHAGEGSGAVSRSVVVNRVSAMRAVKDLGCDAYVDGTVLSGMPIPQERSLITTLHLFKPGYSMRGVDFEKAFAKQGLVPADLYEQAAINEDVTLARTNPNVTCWRDEDGNLCYSGCGIFSGERCLLIDRSPAAWSADWWLVGKIPQKEPRGFIARVLRFFDSK